MLPASPRCGRDCDQLVENLLLRTAEGAYWHTPCGYIDYSGQSADPTLLPGVSWRPEDDIPPRVLHASITTSACRRRGPPKLGCNPFFGGSNSNNNSNSNTSTSTSSEQQRAARPKCRCPCGPPYMGCQYGTSRTSPSHPASRDPIFTAHQACPVRKGQKQSPVESEPLRFVHP